ncbi:uncharacterized protein LOC134820884 [Bolinopsis microptera]|uniref:uncharacterized protein LOC134820884 n=1 Tax=Bolinopsis microptera TaxID=2820187 RepID=UPI003079BBC6
MAKRRKGSGNKGSGAKRQRKVIDIENENELTATECAETVQEECEKVTSSDQQKISSNLAVSQEAGNLVKIQENSQDFDEILMSPKNGNRDQGTYQYQSDTVTADLDDTEEAEKNKSAMSKSFKKLSDNLEKAKKDLIQIREYVDHWKKLFDLAKREHNSLLKNDVVQKQTS